MEVYVGPRGLNFILRPWNVSTWEVSMYICKDTAGNKEEGIVHGCGAEVAGILVKRIMQYKTDSKESHAVEEEVVA